MTTNVRQNVQGLKFSAKENVHAMIQKNVGISAQQTCIQSVLWMVKLMTTNVRQNVSMLQLAVMENAHATVRRSVHYT